jgi:hypothetical protein
MMRSKVVSTHLEDAVLDRLSNGELVNVHVELLSQSMRSIISLIFQSRVPLYRNRQRCFFSAGTRSTYHHRSIKITLLQQVRLRPVLPALNEIKMTLISGLFRMASRACSRLSARMLPSSVQVFCFRVRYRISSHCLPTYIEHI